MAPTIHEEYAELMKNNGSGYFLFRPQPFNKCHPGAIGTFNQNGVFQQITDLSEPGRPEKDGYTAFGDTLIRAPSRTSTWDKISTDSETANSLGVEGGLSGALSAAPVDVSAEAKNKWGKTGKAALITKNIIFEEGFEDAPTGPVHDWIKANAKALTKGKWRMEIADHGLWIISRTWSTNECQIKMESAHSRDTSGGFNVGATGIAKGGANASSSAKSNSEGWTTYTASETDESLVVAYGGTGFKLSHVRKFFGGPLKHSGNRAADPNEYIKLIHDEEGNQTGVEYFRSVFDENGNVIGEEKIDKEAERQAAEEEQKRVNEMNADGGEEDVDVEFGDTFGESDNEEKAKREKNEEFNRKFAAIDQIQDETEKKAALVKLLQESTVTETGTI